jgi:hypothetical protein
MASDAVRCFEKFAADVARISPTHSVRLYVVLQFVFLSETFAASVTSEISRSVRSTTVLP